MDWKKVIGTVAPWIATALGGPLGGLAVEAAADALGLTEKTEESLKNALSGVTGEQMLALKMADQQFQLRMQELGFQQIRDLEKIAADDRDSARKMQTAAQSVVPALLTWCIVSAFATVMFALFVKIVPIENRDIIVYMVGQLSGAFGAVIAFWFGTTRESAKKTEMLAQADSIHGTKP
jgi:leucyl aminopeptidase (aminopeptidase T)